MPNLFDPEFDAEQDQPGFRWRRARLGRQAGAERLGASLFAAPAAPTGRFAPLESGEAAFPYHFHFANEELLIVVAGRPSLRGPEGWRELGEGEVVNRGDSTARVLMVSQMEEPDVVVMPDSGKVQARECAPGAAQSGLWEVFRSADAVDYWDGEEAPDR